MIRVVGMGQPLHGDDAAGWEAVRELPESPRMTKALVCDNLMQILESLRARDLLILVDSVRSGAPPGTIHRCDLADPPEWLEHTQFSSHSLNPLHLLQLTRELGHVLPRRRVLLAIEGECYDIGAPLSARVQDALPELRQRIMTEVGTGRLIS